MLPTLGQMLDGGETFVNCTFEYFWAPFKTTCDIDFLKLPKLGTLFSSVPFELLAASAATIWFCSYFLKNKDDGMPISAHFLEPNSKYIICTTYFMSSTIRFDEKYVL